MIQRVKQFYRAVTAQITPEDRQWVAESLPPAAQKLFYAMHPADQYHAINVEIWTSWGRFGPFS